MKKNNLIMIVVSVSIFVALIMGATYAYFASNTNTGNGLDMTITTDNNNIAFAATEGTLSMHVKAEDMLQSQTGQGDVLAAETIGEDNIIVTLSSNTETPVACTYNVYFKWNTNAGYITPTDATKKELTLKLELQDEDGTGGDGNNRFASETQITKVVTSYDKTLAVQGAVIIGSSSNSGNQEWIPTVRFYNLAKDQSALAGKSLGGKFTIDDVVCDVVSSSTNVNGTLAGLVSSIASNKEYTSSQDGSKYVVQHETVEYIETLDAGVRYEGKDPDNYIEFNGGEEWRIIGAFEGSTIGLEPGKQYVKIIKVSSIGNMDCGTDENDWVKSSVNEYLNGEYLTSLIDKNMIAQYNGNYSTWSLLGPTTSQFNGASTDDSYVWENEMGSPGYRGGVQGKADAQVQSAIGLMYPSDYGFAAYGSSCDKTTSLQNFGTVISRDPLEIGGCAGVDWIYLHEVYSPFITPVADQKDKIYNINGYFGGYISAGGGPMSIRPTLYLESDVYITDGDGSKTNPYKISRPATN